MAGTKDKSKLARMRERLLKPTSASPPSSSSSLPSCQRCAQTLRKSQHSTGVCDACARLSSGSSSRQRAVRRVASFVTARYGLIVFFVLFLIVIVVFICLFQYVFYYYL